MRGPKTAPTPQTRSRRGKASDAGTCTQHGSRRVLDVPELTSRLIGLIGDITDARIQYAERWDEHCPQRAQYITDTGLRDIARQPSSHRSKHKRLPEGG